MKNILIYPCETSEGVELNHALGLIVHFRLHGACSQNLEQGDVVYRNVVARSNGSVDEMNAIIDRLGIDYVYPASREAQLALSEYEAHGWLHAEVIGSGYETNRVCHTSASIDERFRHLRDRTVDGQEFRFCCFTDQFKQLRFVGGIRLKELSCELLDPSVEFVEMARIIQERLDFRGAWSFTACMDEADRSVQLLHVEPGIHPLMSLFRMRGINLFALSIYDRMGNDIEIQDNGIGMTAAGLQVLRHRMHIEYDDVYVDLDETILIRDEVNPLIIAFIFQCRNQGKKVHLITKHRYELEETLQRFRIAQLFDEIIWLKSFDQKYLHMKTERAIFIDDAFSERKQVAEKLGIPTFEVSAVEGLMDWRL